jgi:hypothetical protein
MQLKFFQLSISTTFEKLNIYKRLKYVYQNGFGKNIYHNEHTATIFLTTYKYQITLSGFTYYTYNSIGNDTSLSVMNILMKRN